METNELSKNAQGGTELMLARLHRNIDNDLLREFQVIPTRVRDIDPKKKTILWVHDLPGDPELTHALANNAWKRFEKIVCVSHWQKDAIHHNYHVPYSNMTVIENAISPIGLKFRELVGQKRFIYTSTPHRGLDILYHAFDQYSEETELDVHLDVYSSFSLYGWPDRDEPFQDMFDAISYHNHMTNHGTVTNADIRAALTKAHVFVYPSTWRETSCLCLIEAMSANCLCIHSSLGALPETSGGLTTMYDYTEDQWEHVDRLVSVLHDVPAVYTPNNTAKDQTDERFGIQKFIVSWTELLKGLSDGQEK